VVEKSRSVLLVRKNAQVAQNVSKHINFVMEIRIAMTGPTKPTTSVVRWFQTIF